jgi:hypothetical protein
MELRLSEESWRAVSLLCLGLPCNGVYAVNNTIHALSSVAVLAVREPQGHVCDMHIPRHVLPVYTSIDTETHAYKH